MSKQHADLLLLPQPQRVRRLAGAFSFARRTAISLPPAGTRTELTAVRQLADDLAARGLAGPLSRRHANDDAVPGGVAIRRGRARGGPEAYELNVSTTGIEIVAPSPRGSYYGLQTLRQLVRQFGRRLPALAIRDWPELPLRGVYHDISRGRVPTLATLKYLIELLAHLKVNTFSLYVEYPFRYERHPRIWEDTRPLTAAEILELDEFCCDHGVDFIPSQASFGHLERLLSKPPYHHLANTPPRSLAQTRSFPRLGTSLDPTNPASARLLAELYEEFLPQFSSPSFNACCDEVWDLGAGQSAARAARIGKGRLFAEFILRIERLAHKHGKRLMIWADILKHHPEAIGPIPRDVIFLNWWYNACSKEWMIDHSRAIRDSGHELVVCPGVNNWGAFMPRLGRMRDNIRNFAAAGHRFAATGLLNTEWGDGGHFNLLATALPGFATGAEHAWAHSKADGTTIGRRWPLHLLGDRAGQAERIVALADTSHDTWPAIFTGFGDERLIDFTAMKTTPRALLHEQVQFNQRAAEAMGGALSLTTRLAAEKNGSGALAAMEWTVLSGFLTAKGLAVQGRLQRLLGDAAGARRLFGRAAGMTAELLPRYKELWLMRNHQSELDWSVARFGKMIRRWRRAAKG